MPNFFRIVFLYLFCTNSILKAQSLKVMFVGNSMTYYNDMPKLCTRFAESNNMQMSDSMIAFPGYFLELHCRSHKASKNCNLSFPLEEYDYIIIQEANLRITSNVHRKADKYLLYALSTQIDTLNTKLIFQEPFTCSEEYPKQKRPVIVGDSVLEGDFIESKEAELLDYTTFSEQLQKENICDVAKIGSCFYHLESIYPSIQLTEEGSHPTKLGSVIMAFIIFKNISKIKFPDIPDEYKIYQKEIISTNAYLNSLK